MIYPKHTKDINIKVYTNNHAKYEILNTIKSILDKHLRVEISTLQVLHENNELIQCIENQHNDISTKKGLHSNYVSIKKSQ